MLLDWLVGMAFPCQRPFGHQYGVGEVPSGYPARFGVAWAPCRACGGTGTDRPREAA